jgi:hypothetical protein
VSRIRRVVLFTLIVVAAVYIGLCAVLYFAQASLIYYPQSRATIEGVEVATFEVADAHLEISQRERAGPDAVLYFGGNAEDVARAVPALAEVFPERSIHALHYRGYGGSTGKPREALIVHDALALFDAVRARHERIVVIGRSLGSGVAVQVAARRDVERLVLVTPFASIRALAQEQFPFLPTRLILRNGFESATYAAQVRAPTLLVIAARDQVIPRRSSDALLTAFRPGVARAVVLPGDHNSSGFEATYRAALQD